MDILWMLFLCVTQHLHGITEANSIGYYFLSEGDLLWLSNVSKTFDGAREVCRSMEGRLGTFGTNDEYFGVAALLGDYFGQAAEVWIDFNFTVTDSNSNFYWRKEKFNSSVWAPREPSVECLPESQVQCCARMSWSGPMVYEGLKDNVCWAEYLFLCQVKMADCTSGYQYNLTDNSCQDVDECVSGICKSECPVLQCSCSNTAGSYRCDCPAGYTKVDGVCADVDECQGNHTCPQLCQNTPGGYTCLCRLGYTLAGVTCVDVNECDNEPNVCKKTCNSDSCPKECRNTEGSFSCECREGFYKASDKCLDVDECQGRHNCSQKCENTPGSYRCACEEGFKLQGDSQSECVDINECLMSNTCEHNCTNTLGSFNCSCRDGYSLGPNGKSCHDVNECREGPSICDVMCPDSEHCFRNCINTPGGYTCECAPGFDEIDGECMDVDECNVDPTCSQRCENTPGRFRCTCDDGFQISPSDNTQCDDINECLDDHNDCDHNCTNTNGSYYCTCRTGYHLNTTDNKTCHDINECDNTTLCQHRCHNTPGSYFCACPDGFQTSSDGSTCVRRASSSFCPCQCYLLKKNMTAILQNINTLVESIIDKNLLDIHNLSSYIGKRVSAEDSRKSAQGVGYSGVVMMTFTLGLVIVPDLLAVLNWALVKVNLLKTNQTERQS